jgi:mono/diheme cytochrome c family protein
MRRFFAVLVGLAILGTGAAWLLTAPKLLADDTFANLTGDPARGELVFWAAGCASCHMAADATGEAELILSGGQKFVTAFGTFIAPNISPDADQGIGGWSLIEFANAVQRGVTPQGQHLYPAFPYASYQNMVPQDVVDLKSFMDTLPASAAPSLPHEISFPFNIRRSIGGWKMLFLPDGWAVAGDLTESETRGRYLAEAMAHCGECHTPRNALGGMERDRWLAGAPNPSGKGSIPNITPAKLEWSEDEIMEYLTSGFTPEYDSAGGHMAHVVENLARLPESDRASIAAYLKRVAPAE